MDPLVSIVIPTYNRTSYLLKTLMSLARQSENRFEVIVVDDGSEKSSRDDVQKIERDYDLSYVRTGRRGRASARNRGIERAVGEVILFLDDHTQAHYRLVEEHLRAHRGRVGRGGYRGRIEYVDDFLDPVCYWAPRLFRSLHSRIYQNSPIVDFGTHNLSVSRAVIDRVGPFDERFTLYGGEDQEFGIRIREAGFKLGFLPKALAFNIRIPKGTAGALDRAIESGRMAALLAVTHPRYRARMGLNLVNRLVYAGGTSRRLYDSYLRDRERRDGEKALPSSRRLRRSFFILSFSERLEELRKDPEKPVT
jgi:GT2 family glycosyltransferase